MLTERALQIFDKLIECNTQPVTSKMLALYLGVSERSVKNYIKEVTDYCVKHDMELTRKPGKGFVANFTQSQIALIEKEQKEKKTVLTQKNRMSYIMYILLSGWDSYTISLFSEELNVSKKVISEDLDVLSVKIAKYDLRINRIAGQGISISGSEFSIRRALREYCVFPIGNKTFTKTSSSRLTMEDESVCINNFGNENFTLAYEIVKGVENKYGFCYTDYSFKMLISYLCIGFARMRLGHTIDEKISLVDDDMYCRNIGEYVEKVCQEKEIVLTEYEKQYIDILFAGAQIQGGSEGNIQNRVYAYDYDNICSEMLEYLSKVLDKNFTDNELLRRSIREYLPASFIRTRYKLIINNPFLNDVKEMYSGIFAISFAIAGFYEKHCSATPTEHEIAFLALYIGGAIVRNTKDVKAVLIGTSGVAAASIVARKIENIVDEIEIVAILSSEEEDELDNYDYDIILSMVPESGKDSDIIEISPIIGERDIKKIMTACYSAATNNGGNVGKDELSKLISSECIEIVEGKRTQKQILKHACDRMYELGYVAEHFYDDVIEREKISPTAIGGKVAIPHGMADNVCKPVVYVIYAKDGVDWGPETVDMIFVLALNFDNIVTTKAFFSEFSKLLESEEKMRVIRNAQTEDTIADYIREIHT